MMKTTRRENEMTFTFGREFKIHVFGESHGECIGVSIEGCPPGLEIDKGLIQVELDMRRPGTGHLVSSRKESDEVTIQSGVFNGRTTGAPITLMVSNTDVDSSSYEIIRTTPRPGHADYTSRIKYGGFNDYRGGGVFSGRITVAYVMAGSIAKYLLGSKGYEVLTHTVQVGKERVTREVSNEEIRSNVYSNPVRCADAESVEKLQTEIENARLEGDSVGGIIECRVLGVPVGIGEPLFDSVESIISHAMFSIPGVKGIEFGSGFRAAAMSGSENNDPLIIREGEIGWDKNDAGGSLGGITNGAPVVFRVAFKPTPSISKEQQSVNLERMKETSLRVGGRHDPCIVPRAVSVVEGLTAVAFVDLIKRVMSWK
jgi:chorismate synthase